MIVILIIGCSKGSIPTATQTQTPTKTQTPIEAKLIYAPEITFEELESSIFFDDFEQTLALLGDEYNSYYSHYSGTQMYQYIIVNDKDYRLSLTFDDDEAIISSYDEWEAIAEGKIKYMLILGQYENKISHYSISYRHEHGTIRTYFHFRTGQTKEDIHSLL